MLELGGLPCDFAILHKSQQDPIRMMKVDLVWLKVKEIRDPN